MIRTALFNIYIFLFFVWSKLSVVIRCQSIYSDGNGKVDRLQRALSENVWRLKQLEAKVNDISRSPSDASVIAAQQRGKIENNENKLKELTSFLTRPGSTYIRWGNYECPVATSTLVYQGYIAGKTHQRRGSGSNTLCLHKTPKWTVYRNGTQGARAYIYGGGFESDDGDPDNLLPGYSSRQEDGQLAFCAVCRTRMPRVTIMIPGTNECEAGWTKEYDGFLMANKDRGFYSTEYICVDHNPTYSNKLNNGQFLLYYTEVRCGALPCSEYVDGREVTCVVCSG